MAIVTIERAEETSVKAVEISVRNSVNNIQVSITKLDEKPVSLAVDVAGRVYRYLNVDKQNINDEDISSAKITFQVEKTWINSNNVNRSTVALQRYGAGEWNKLPTYEVSEDAENVYYEAESSGLSIYAISAETVTPTPTPTSTPTPTPTTTPTPTPTPTPTSTSTPTPTPSPPSELLGIPLKYIVALVLAIVVIVAVALALRHIAGKRVEHTLSG